MDPETVRTHAESFSDALVAGDIDRAALELSKELRSNLGPLVGLLPLPVASATIESIDRTGSSGFNVVLNLVGESTEVRLQTRWKDRDGEPTIVEASHLTEAAIAAAGPAEEQEPGEGEADAAVDEPV
ncbi:MAG TPA: hypothetical protein VGQ64_00870 [Candidatus Limnocylindrales bacterium]|jgi:hypothetical protein|nr:hypothetical protein [Candidatus Limnocylindrales bacterium]